MGNSGSSSANRYDATPNMGARLHMSPLEDNETSQYAPATYALIPEGRRRRKQRRRTSIASLTNGIASIHIGAKVSDESVARLINSFMQGGMNIEQILANSKQVLFRIANESATPEIEVRLLIAELFNRRDVLDTAWLILVLLLAVPTFTTEKLDTVLRDAILHELSIRNTAQASFYMLFMPASIKRISADILVEDVLQFLDNTGILAGGFGNLRRNTASWQWNEQHPLTRHIDMTEQFVAQDRWNTDDVNHLVIVSAPSTMRGAGRVKALEGTDMFDILPDPIGQGSFGIVFRLINEIRGPTTQIATPKRKRRCVQTTDEEFLLKVGLNTTVQQEAIDEMVGSGLALACSWLSFIVNAPTVAIMFRGERIIVPQSRAPSRSGSSSLGLLDSEVSESSPSTTSSQSSSGASATSPQFAILMDNVGDHRFNDVDPLSIPAVFAQTWLALAAFHRYTRKLHNDISQRNVTIQRSLDIDQLRGIRYIITDTDVVSVQPPAVATMVRQPLFVDSLPPLPDAVVLDVPAGAATTIPTSGTVVDVSVNADDAPSFFTSLIDFGLLMKIDKVIALSSFVYAFDVAKGLLQPPNIHRIGIEKAWATASFNDVQKSQRLSIFLNEIFASANVAMRAFVAASERVDFTDGGHFAAFLQPQHALNIFEQEEELLAFLKDSRSMNPRIHRIQMLLVNKLTAGGEQNEQDPLTRMRILQGMLMERMYGDNMHALFMYGMYVVAHDFVPFVMDILTMQQNVDRKLVFRSMREPALDNQIVRNGRAMAYSYAVLGECFVKAVVPVAKRAVFSNATIPPNTSFADTGTKLRTDIVAFLSAFTWNDELDLILTMLRPSVVVNVQRGVDLQSAVDSLPLVGDVRIANMVPSAEDGHALVLESLQAMTVYRIGGRIVAEGSSDDTGGKDSPPSKKQKTRATRLKTQRTVNDMYAYQQDQLKKADYAAETCLRHVQRLTARQERNAAKDAQVNGTAE